MVLAILLFGTAVWSTLSTLSRNPDVGLIVENDRLYMYRGCAGCVFSLQYQVIDMGNVIYIRAELVPNYQAICLAICIPIREEITRIQNMSVGEYWVVLVSMDGTTTYVLDITDTVLISQVPDSFFLQVIPVLVLLAPWLAVIEFLGIYLLCLIALKDFSQSPIIEKLREGFRKLLASLHLKTSSRYGNLLVLAIGGLALIQSGLIVFFMLLRIGVIIGYIPEVQFSVIFAFLRGISDQLGIPRTLGDNLSWTVFLGVLGLLEFHLGSKLVVNGVQSLKTQRTTIQTQK